MLCYHLKVAPLALLLQVPLLAGLHWYPQQEHHLSLCLQGAMQCPFQPQEECLMIGLQQPHKLVTPFKSLPFLHMFHHFFLYVFSNNT